MVDDTDVSAEPSSATADTPPNATAPAPVSADVSDQVVEDRPLKNLQAEWNRKFGKLETTLSTIESLLQSQRQAEPKPQPTGWEQYTDEQLMELYRSGSAEAGVKLNERLVTRQVQAASAATAKTQAVQGQLSLLYAKYPQLRDTASPLYRAAMQAKTAMVGTGMYTNSQETDVQAILMAIADNPDLVRSPEPTPARRDHTTAQNQMDGSTQRRVPPPVRGGQPVALSQKERDIASRMGVKDPAKARERFLERQQKGRSSVTPVIAVALKEE